jgi:ATP-dependent phosphofructokinase / diphosphate-dependent phosphofructokinase
MKTLKGNAVIGQSGGPTCVINQSLVGALLEASRHGEITGLYGALHGVQGVLKEEFIDLGAESRETLERVAATPSAALGSVRKKPTPEECLKIFEVFKVHDVRYFFYIGGNDSAESADIISRLARESGYELRVCHIPKTIDNDLLVTDHCPGFGSAARFVAMAFQGDDLDNRSLNGVKIDVVMGRHAGFLTAASVLGRSREDDGPHLVYVPERPFSLDRFCGDVDAVLKRLKRCVVAVSEGISDENGQPVYQSGEVDAHGNVQLSGSGALGDFLASTIRQKLGISRVRADTFGYLQRCFPGAISAVDADEARRVGTAAIRAVTDDGYESGSVALRRVPGDRYASETFITPLETVAKRTRHLDDRFLAPARSDITGEFVSYAKPLVGDLPVIGHLAKRPVPRKPTRS